MTAYTDDIDRKVITYLRRIERRGEAKPTVGDMYDALGIPTSSIRASVRRLIAAGEVTQAGQAFNGGRTWKLTPREGA